MRWKVKRASWKVGTNHANHSPEIIVSLTSYPKRFRDIDLCLKSLCIQSVKPNRIILWLGSDTSQDAVNKIEEKYLKYGIEIRWDDKKNLYSHKKYYYVMQEFPDDIIITADDDLIYPFDWIKSLLVSYRKNPDCISARRVHWITWRSNDCPEAYRKWTGEFSGDVPSNNLLATTGAGTLFPPHCFNKECFNSDAFLNYARTADDLWIKVMAILSKRKVVWAPNSMPMPTTVDLQQREKLENINCEGGGNDMAFRNLLRVYNLSKNDFVN